LWQTREFLERRSGQAEQIQEICTDMSMAYIKGIGGVIADLGPPITELNPYRTPAGPERAAFIHQQVMAEAAVADACPPYSTDFAQARKVLAKLKASHATSVIYGQTSLADRPWFARIEGKHGMEVLAEALPLAICRLALLSSGVGTLNAKGHEVRSSDAGLTAVS
jgi:hypothetical protein